MKPILHIVALSCLCCVTAAGQGLPGIKKTATGIAASPYLHISQQYIKVLQALSDSLSTVQDTATADAAAPTVANLHTQLRSIKEQESKLPPPTNAVQQYLQTELSAKQTKTLCRSSVSKALQLICIQQPACYGSQALQKELQAVLDTLASSPKERRD